MYSINRKLFLLCDYIFGDEYLNAIKVERQVMNNHVRELVVDELFYGYLTQKHYEKYDPQYSLSTWVATYIHNNINNIIRKHAPRDPKKLGRKPKGDFLDIRNGPLWTSIEDRQEWLNTGDYTENPEVILSARQLLALMLDFFGEVDTKVLLKLEDKAQVVIAAGINAGQYDFHLRQKRQLFIQKLHTIGYLP